MFNDIKRRITCHIKPSILMKMQVLRNKNKTLTSRNVSFERAADFYYHFVRYLYSSYRNDSNLEEMEEYIKNEITQWLDIFKGEF